MIKVVTFAKRPRLVEPGDKDDPKKPPAIGRHVNEKGERGDLGAGTNLQAALQLAYGLYIPGYLKRGVLLSDGVQTDGDVLAEANRARDFGIKLFTSPSRRPAPPVTPIGARKRPASKPVPKTMTSVGRSTPAASTIACGRTSATRWVITSTFGRVSAGR